MVADGFALRHPERLEALHEPGPMENDEFPYGQRCTACRQPWPCAREQGRRHVDAAQKATAAKELRLRHAQASRVGAIAMTTLGFEVYSAYSATHREDGDFAVGGVVVEIDDSGDPETGEVERRYGTLDGHVTPVRMRIIHESDVDRSLIAVADISTMSRLVYRLADEIRSAGINAKSGHVRTTIDTRVADKARWIATLCRILMTGAA